MFFELDCGLPSVEATLATEAPGDNVTMTFAGHEIHGLI